VLSECSCVPFRLSVYFKIYQYELSSDLNKIKIARETFILQPIAYSIRCVATIQADSDCMSDWYLHAGKFSADARKQSGASTLAECQTACEFDPRCVTADWHTASQECWISTNSTYPHHTPTGWSRNDYHYHLVSRCNITTGQCLHDILTMIMFTFTSFVIHGCGVHLRFMVLG